MVLMNIDKNLLSARRSLYSTYWDKKISQKFCVGCRCRTNFKLSNRHNSPPNGARESKITPLDSEPKRTVSLDFFLKKMTFLLCFHFTISLKINRQKDYEYTYDYGDLIATDDSYDNNDGDSQDSPRDYDSVSYNQFFREVPLDYYYDPDELSLAGSADEEGPVREDYDYSQDLRTMSMNPARALRKTFLTGVCQISLIRWDGCANQGWAFEPSGPARFFRARIKSKFSRAISKN